MRLRMRWSMWLIAASVLVVAGTAAAITEPGFLFTQTFAPASNAVVSSNCDVLNATPNYAYDTPGPSFPAAEYVIYSCGPNLGAFNVNQPGVHASVLFYPEPTSLGYGTPYGVPIIGVNYAVSGCSILEGATPLLGSVALSPGGGWDYCFDVTHAYSTSLPGFEATWIQG
jgi:hypothetical protein